MPTGHSPARVLARFSRLPGLLWAAVICARRFRDPLQVLRAYATGRPPASRQVRLRSGLTIQLSDDRADIATVFGVFARESYGTIASGSTVVDIGANIGAFALFAAWAGAAIVHAYEPCAESFAILQRNITDNHLEAVIRPHRQAVVGRPSEAVMFPRRSNVFNAIVTGASGDHELVSAVTLSDILAATGPVDVLKIDCEGAEFEIVANTPCAVMSQVSSIKLQYHAGPRDTLTGTLETCGFCTKQWSDEGTRGGYLWMTQHE